MKKLEVEKTRWTVPLPTTGYANCFNCILEMAVWGDCGWLKKIKKKLVFEECQKFQTPGKL